MRLLLLSEVGFLEADNVAFGNKVSKSTIDAISARDTSGVRGVEGEAVNVVGQKARNKSGGG